MIIIKKIFFLTLYFILTLSLKILKIKIYLFVYIFLSHILLLIFPCFSAL